MYVEGNPVNYSDPTGNSICYDPLPAYCQNGLVGMRATASLVKELVRSGAWMPVDGFAAFAGFSELNYFSNIRDLVWAMTIVLNDMDANRGAIWRQALDDKMFPKLGLGPARSSYFIKGDWLPYQTQGSYRWCFPKENKDNCWREEWTHSRIGDWKAEYWDKTANQAYHFWFYVATTFFNTVGAAEIGNLVHENLFPYRQPVAEYNFITSPEFDPPPLPSQGTEPDIRLAVAGEGLGSKLRKASFIQEHLCLPAKEAVSLFLPYGGIGMWISSNLK
jgi:hypothetical protein